MSNFKTLHSVKFDNVKVTAFYEYKILPVEAFKRSKQKALGNAD